VALDPRKARDIALLDALDAFPRESLRQKVWRVVREGRDPLMGAASHSRWCNGAFDVLYTSLEREGAMSEVYALLSSQPIFPSKPRWFVHRIAVECRRALRIADMSALGKLGVDMAGLRSRDYTETQDIADAAFFLDFDAMLVPTARWSCLNVVLFTDKLSPSDVVLQASEPDPIDWNQWKAAPGR
jgi:RES domain-containing protein